jgi:hypothetical protein
MVRDEKLRLLRDMDPDMVVDELALTSEDMMEAFPNKVEKWLDGEKNTEAEYDAILRDAEELFQTNDPA